MLPISMSQLPGVNKICLVEHGARDFDSNGRPMATGIRNTKTKTFAKFDNAPHANARSTPESEPATRSRHSTLGLSNDAPHAGDVTSGLADAHDRVGDRLDRDRHMEGIGV